MALRTGLKPWSTLSTSRGGRDALRKKAATQEETQREISPAHAQMTPPSLPPKPALFSHGEMMCTMICLFSHSLLMGTRRTWDVEIGSIKSFSCCNPFFTHFLLPNYILLSC